MCILSVDAQLILSQGQGEDRRVHYNFNLFEGDIKISSKEIETYYEDINCNEQSTNVSKITLVSIQNFTGA